LELIERLVWRPLGYPELVFELIESVCFVVAASAVTLFLLRRSKRPNTGAESLLDEVQRNEQQVLLLARAVESTSDSIVITDLSGSIEYVNPHFEKLTGYTRAEVYGKNPRVLQSGRQPRAFYAELWRTLKSGGVWNGRFINRRKDGTLYTEEATISPVHDAYGIPQKYVAVKRDVTRLEELEGQLRQAQKMEAVGQLAGGIAHDLNNVLQVVTLASHLALTSHDLEFKDARIKETVDAAQKGAGVIRQLLAFSRRQLMRPEVLRLNEVIHDTVKLLKHLLQEDIKLRLDLDHELGNIKADPIQITQVMLNLALNARDAMPEGGLLEISTENFEVTAESEAVTSQVPPGGYVRMIVRDTGTGMDEATQSRVFEPFFTTKETGKGTGLGLSTVYGIVIQSGGFIRFDSAVGVGTTFFVCFPRTQQPMAAPPHEVNRAEVALTPERCSVLVVEDEEMVRNSMAEALRRQGFRVHASGSSQEAWEAAVKLKPNLVIADVVMAGMKGPELIGLLKMHNPSIQTILISGYSDAEQVRLATASHASLFISKPFSMSELVESAIRLCKLRQ
jgi:PAS domain S-box-containing protein